MKPKHFFQAIVLLLISSAVISFVDTENALKLIKLYKCKAGCAMETTTNDYILFQSLTNHLPFKIMR